MKWFKIETLCFTDWNDEISYKLFPTEKKAREWAEEMTVSMTGRYRVTGFASKAELLGHIKQNSIQLDTITKQNVNNDSYYYDTITPTTEVFKIVPAGYPGEREELPYSKDRLFYGDRWYLHGLLEDLFGYDKAWFLDLPEKYLVDRYIDRYEFKESFINGIVECQVEGYDGPCTGYFWVTPDGIQRGLVCSNSDMEANKDAKERYEKRVTYL